MASKRHRRRRTCGHKRGYSTHDLAVRQVAWLYATQPPGEQFSCYRCRACGRYHVGHTPQWLRAVRQAEGRAA